MMKSMILLVSCMMSYSLLFAPPQQSAVQKSMPRSANRKLMIRQMAGASVASKFKSHAPKALNQPAIEKRAKKRHKAALKKQQIRLENQW
jgi:hypothetical protein